MWTIVRAAALALLALGLQPPPAKAQSEITYVSNTGTGANDCFFRTSPCSEFQRAHDQTSNGGTIVCLDSYDYGPLEITKSITIDCLGHVARAGHILINTPDVVVVLRGLTVTGHYGRQPGGSGIEFRDGNALHVKNSHIIGWGNTSSPGIGIWFKPTGTSRLYVTDSVISENGLPSSGGGIVIQPSGAGSARATITRSVLNQNTYGIFANGMGSTGVIIAQIKDTTVSGSLFNGISAFTAPIHSTTSITVDHSSSLLSGGDGILAQGQNGFVILANSTVMSNTTGLHSVAGGGIFTYQNNQLSGNASDGAPTVTLSVR